MSLLVALAALAVLGGGSNTAGAAQLGWFGPILPDSNGGSGERAQAVACPSTSQCTAVDNQGQQVTFNPTVPGEPTPTTIDPGNELSGLACPSTNQCTAVDNEGQQVTFDPTAPASFVLTKPSFDSLDDVACPSLNQCIGVGNPTSNVVTFNPPAAEHPSIVALDPSNGLGAVACPSTSQCTAVDLLGQQVTFDPLALGDPAPTTIDVGAWPQGLACPSTSQCTVVDDFGRQVTFDPVSPGDPATTAIAAGSWLWGVACPSARQCTAAGSSGDVTFNPTEPGAQAVTRPENDGLPRAIACPSTGQCTAVEGDEEVTFNPTETPSPITPLSTITPLIPMTSNVCIGPRAARCPSSSQCPTFAGSAVLTLGRRPTRSTQARIVPGKQVGVTLSSVSIERSNGTQLRFAGATFRIDNSAQHPYRKSAPTETSSKTTVILTTFSADAAAHRPPAIVEPLDAGLRPGIHTLTMKLYYKKIRDTHGRRTVSRITHTLTARFGIC